MNRITASLTALIAAMAANPVLIERPVVLHRDRAALGRPPEAVLEDVRLERYSVQQAAQLFGVVVDGAPPRIDAEGTQALRGGRAGAGAATVSRRPR